jgi:sugar phosphate isomerase/epimerase
MPREVNSAASGRSGQLINNYYGGPAISNRIMVHFAVSSMFFHEYPCEEVFDFVTESGLDAIEFWAETPHFWLRDLPLDELCACIAHHPALSPVNLHAPILDLNPCSINPKVAEASVYYTLHSIEMAEKTGAEVVTIHPGRRTAKRLPSGADYDRFERYISLVRSVSRGKRVRVAIENMEKKVNSLLSTPAELRELLDREPWLWFTLDVSHAMGVSMEEISRYLDLCGDRMINVHLSRASDGKMHLPLDRSAAGCQVLLQLRDCRYDGNVTLEIEDRNFPHDLCSEEKILLLSRELEFMREFLG